MIGRGVGMGEVRRGGRGLKWDCGCSFQCITTLHNPISFQDRTSLGSCARRGCVEGIMYVLC